MGVIWGIFWRNSEYILVSYGIYFGVIRGIFGCHMGLILGQFEICFVVIWGICLGNSMYIWVPYDVYC